TSNLSCISSRGNSSDLSCGLSDFRDSAFPFPSFDCKILCHPKHSLGERSENLYGTTENHRRIGSPVAVQPDAASSLHDWPRAGQLHSPGRPARLSPPRAHTL